ncbi:hypothetical protein [Marinitoga aeolica]|uniref:Uncharacterized protein n=1 Tax=Marinitoga aeolica TaxID=2809031 RepID=A0ABY8PTJ9_9BACT|nr:hypothetical protein [Marinitoga aeolica]WGS65969.1 hypothetical protein JRV97_05320 [Marinitoga aeolica]
MKKIFISFIITIIALTLFSNDIFIFKNIGIISMDYPWTDEINIPLHKDENVVFIENADFYKVNISELKNISFKIIGSTDDLKNVLGSRISMLNSNPVILKDALNLNYIYFFNSYLNMWCRTDAKNLDTLLNHKTLYAKNIKGKVLISKPISWNLFYDLKSNGDLFVTYKISGNTKELYNATLIDETFNLDDRQINNKTVYTKTMSLEAAPYIPLIVNESAIVNFGKIEPFNGVFSKVMKLGTIKKYEDINYLNINFYSRSFENKYMNIMREFENTKDNGIGVPLIKGNIYIFTKKDGKEFIQKVATLSKANENETAEIFLGQSWNSTADLQILNESRSKDHIDKTFKFNVKSSGKTKITINGTAMKLLSVKGTYLKKVENSDKISFYIQGNQSLEITIRNDVK